MAFEDRCFSVALWRAAASRETDLPGHLAGAIVARGERDLGALRRAHGPLALAAVGGEREVGQERLQAHLVRPALELRALDARLPREELRARGQRDLVDDAAHHLSLERALG